MWIKIKKILHHIFITDYCDTCGLTRSKVFLTEIYIESGLNQCENCIKRNGKKIEKYHKNKTN